MESGLSAGAGMEGRSGEFALLQESQNGGDCPTGVSREKESGKRGSLHQDPGPSGP